MNRTLQIGLVVAAIALGGWWWATHRAVKPAIVDAGPAAAAPGLPPGPAVAPPVASAPRPGSREDVQRTLDTVKEVNGINQRNREASPEPGAKQPRR